MSSWWATALAAAIALTTAPAALAEDAPASPPKLDLSISERGPGMPWRMRILNQGDEPVRLATDPRLLWFDVKVPGARKKTTCRIPKGLFPFRVDPDFAVVLEPDRAFALEFDPRLYCFAAGPQKKLVPGALVTPHFGWPEKTKTVWRKGKRVKKKLDQFPPFAVEPVAEETDVEKTKGIVGTPFALRSTYADWTGHTPLPKEGEGEKPDPTPLALTMSRGSDARAERTATVAVKLRNRSKRSLRVYFRRELVSFEIMGPDGLVVCNPKPDDRAPDRQAFLRMRPGRTMTIHSRLVELCPRDTFGRPGLYLINAWLDATDAGHRFGIDAFTGRIPTTRPAAVRIRSGTKPFLIKKKKKKRGKHAKHKRRRRRADGRSPRGEPRIRR